MNRLNHYFESRNEPSIGTDESVEWPFIAADMLCGKRQRKALPTLSPAPSPEVAAELLRQGSRIAALEVEVAKLRRELRASSRNTSSSPENVEPRLADVLTVTQQMFAGCTPQIELSHDPEDPEHPFVVITVTARGEPRELIRQRLAWHAEVKRLSPGNSGAIRLSIIPS